MNQKMTQQKSKNTSRFATILYLLLASSLLAFEPAVGPESSAGWTLMTWNDLGMHCMDEDFAVFAILPPFNTLNAQLIDQNGNRIDGTGGINLYYESAIDPDGSQTYQSFTGTNFWQNAITLLGLNLNDDEGL